MKNRLKTILTVLVVSVLSLTAVFAVSCGEKDDLVKKSIDYYSDADFHSETTYTYDDDNRLIETVDIMGREGKTDTTKDIYKYSGDSLVSREVYHLTEDNVWVMSFLHLYGYNENGGEVSSLGYGVDEGVKSLFALDITEYNEKGLVSKKISYLNDEETNGLFAYMMTEYTYDDKDVLIKEVLLEDIDGDGEMKVDSYYTFSYDESGKITEEKFYDAEDELESVTRYFYDEKGLKISEKGFEVNDVAEVLYYKSESEYDKKGRLIKESVYYANEETGELELDYYTVYEY